MKDSIRRKLETISERFGEITALLAEPETQNDNNQFRSLSQEYAQLDPIVSTYQKYVGYEQEIEAAEEMMSDPEMAELAEESLDEAKENLENLLPELQKLLLPKDPNDDKNIFLEVRAGTGGAEAALFSGDLLRMYRRYAEIKGWRSEIISESVGEHGGYKEVPGRQQSAHGRDHGRRVPAGTECSYHWHRAGPDQNGNSCPHQARYPVQCPSHFP